MVRNRGLSSISQIGDSFSVTNCMQIFYCLLLYLLYTVRIVGNTGKLCFISQRMCNFNLFIFQLAPNEPSNQYRIVIVFIIQKKIRDLRFKYRKLIFNSRKSSCHFHSPIPIWLSSKMQKTKN